MLPDPSWIAIVCGVSQDQWQDEGDDEDSGLPDGFFVAPKDVYMPDLTAASDVLLGKLVSLNSLQSWRGRLAAPYLLQHLPSILFRDMGLYLNVLIRARRLYMVCL